VKLDELIDRFVARLDPEGSVFSPIVSAPWIDLLEQKLPKRFPASFRTLLTRYAFPSFDAVGLNFFANTGVDSLEELGVAIFKDRFIADATLKAGYVQFARAQGGAYDPVCFDARSSVSNREFPIVRLDHEEILCRDRVRVVETVADSFYHLIADFLDTNKETP